MWDARRGEGRRGEWEQEGQGAVGALSWHKGRAQEGQRGM